MIHRGWKVVDRSTGAYVSVSIRQGRVTYRLNEWTIPEPRCGPLCVFSAELQAINFARSMDSSKIVFPCEYKISMHRSIWNSQSDTMSLAYLPYGTRLASRVRLLEKETK